MLEILLLSFGTTRTRKTFTLSVHNLCECCKMSSSFDQVLSAVRLLTREERLRLAAKIVQEAATEAPPQSQPDQAEDDDVLILTEPQDWADPVPDNRPDLRIQLNTRRERRTRTTHKRKFYNIRTCYRCKEPGHKIEVCPIPAQAVTVIRPS